MGNMKEVIPRLIPFFNKECPLQYNQMFGHELAHCIEIVHRGQPERLKLENFGWPIGVFGHTPKTATFECRVFALQYLLEEELLGNQSNDLLNLENVNLVLSTPRSGFIWKSDADRVVWLKNRRPDYYICNFMKDYRPNFKSLLNTTVDYIVDECAELV